MGTICEDFYTNKIRPHVCRQNLAPDLAFYFVVLQFDFEALLESSFEFGVDDEELVPNQFPTIAVAVDTKLDVLFLDESSAENTWIVPWLLEATNKLESGLKHVRMKIKIYYITLKTFLL